MVATLAIWLRSFIFLRNFEGFSWIISLTIRSIFDMGFFLLIFFIGVIAFADVFHSVFAKFKLQDVDDSEIDGGDETVMDGGEDVDSTFY